LPSLEGIFLLCFRREHQQKDFALVEQTSSANVIAATWVFQGPLHNPERFHPAGVTPFDYLESNHVTR